MSETITLYILTALASLIILSIHELSHALASYKLGDPTAKALGRLTLNPLKHIDVFGAICMVLFRFGWAKPVPIDPRYFKKPKRDFAIVALAGPLSNLLMAFFSAFLYLFVFALVRDLKFESEFKLSIVQTVINFLYIFHVVNVGYAVFNLLPVPPLDGSRILNVILPERIYFRIMRYERKIYFALLGWLILGDALKSFLLSVSFISASPVLSTVASIFSLSDMLSSAFAFISNLILELWQLIPFLKI